VDPETGSHTQTIESSWNSCKKKKCANYGIKRTFIPQYLNEYIWKKRIRADSLDPFRSLLTDIIANRENI
jgi:hypothetical protein